MQCGGLIIACFTP
ncbi:DUF3265 domain-containing protein [Vibrio parahaemolyticus]|nr:DUF3265 domain-containing protein [Vibrio parahaemolyticus]